MPFKSKAQRRYMYWAESKGKLPEGTAKKWEEHTPKNKELPEKVKEASMSFKVGFEKKAFFPLLKNIRGLGRSVAQGLGTLAPKTPQFLQKPMQGLTQWAQRKPLKAGLATIGAGTALGVGAIGAASTMFGKGSKPTPAPMPTQAPMAKMGSFTLGFEKKAGVISKGINKLVQAGEHADFGHAAELAGLGILAAPSAYNIAKGKGTWKDTAESLGLGVLALPSAAHFAGKLIKH